MNSQRTKLTLISHVLRALVYVFIILFGFPIFQLVPSASANQSVDVAPSSDTASFASTVAELSQRGKSFRAEVNAAPVETDATARTDHFTKLCEKYIPPGMKFEDLETFLQAAGERGVLVQPDPASLSAKRYGNTFFAIIPLYESFVTSAVFKLSFQARDISAPHKTVASMICTVSRTAL